MPEGRPGLEAPLLDLLLEEDRRDEGVNVSLGKSLRAVISDLVLHDEERPDKVMSFKGVSSTKGLCHRNGGPGGKLRNRSRDDICGIRTWAASFNKGCCDLSRPGARGTRSRTAGI
mmetsp:Transcript_15629/g.43195  ORF Transcript_15629/g.43195 Transcript_15629/m.43195 type:complete len:116 (+) Transcript_15629:1196-1543(+)